jgi:hypothetical protein
VVGQKEVSRLRRRLLIVTWDGLGFRGVGIGTTAPVLPVGYVVSVSRIADRRMILAGYRLADLLTQFLGD